MPENETLELIYQRFDKAKDAQARKSFETDMEISKRAFKGHPFSDTQETSMKDSGLPVVKVSRGTTNALRFASILTASRPELKAVAKGRGDGGVATLISRAYQKVWEQNRAGKINFRVVLALVREGLSHFNVKTERYGLAGDVRIKISKLDAKKVVYDPETSEDNLEDWRYRIVYRAISKEEAKDLYKLTDEELYYETVVKPEDDDSAGDHDSKHGGSYDDAPGGQKKETKRIVWELEYWAKRKYKVKYLLDMDTLQSIPLASEPTKAEKEALLQSDRYKEITVIECDLKYCLVCGKKIVVDVNNPHGKDQLSEPVDPIVDVVNIPIGETYPRGNMFFADGPLQEISKRRAQSIAVVSATLGSPILVKKGSGVDLQAWRKNLSRPREILEADWDDPGDKPSTIYQNIPDMSRIFMLEDRAHRDLDDVFNLSPVLKGEAETGRMSGRLASMLREFGMEGNSYLLASMEEAFRRLGVCIVVMALNEWPFHYWQRLVEDEDMDEQGKPLPSIVTALKKLEAKDVSIIDYDIGIRSGSSLPSSRMARLDFAVELSREPVHPDAVYDIEAVLAYIDDPQAEGVLRRRGKLKQAMNQMQQMGGEMENMAKQLDSMTADMQQKDEELDKIKIQHVEDMGKQKWRYEITLEKLNLRLAAMREKKQQAKSK